MHVTKICNVRLTWQNHKHLEDALMTRLFTVGFALMLYACRAAGGAEYFTIEVIDSQTRRGVPLVEVETVNSLKFITDSNGIVAFHEPGMMDQKVFFTFKSHGYELPKDGFGFAGKAIDLKPGGHAQVEINRVNIAERMYRITGAGIYADSVLTGRKPPIKQPLLNANVLGQDSVQSVVYKGKIWWFWGDTNRISYPLGNFFTTCATSELPGKGGLDPGIGVDLEYIKDDEGFVKKMIPIPSEGNPVWLDSLIVMKDEKGVEKLCGDFIRVKTLGTNLERGIVIYNDEKGVFEKAADIPLDAVVGPVGQAVRVKQSAAGSEQSAGFIYFTSPYPNIRVKDELKSFLDRSQYEAYTPLIEGAIFEKEKTKLDRKDGRVIWSWKKNTAPLTSEEQQQLVAAGVMKQEDSPQYLRDVETGRPWLLHNCSVDWNEHRKKYVMIGLEMKAKESYIGEVWYAEADQPEGPWLSAKKIVTHNRYTFYNPRRHSFFDQQGGRLIYFEGTFSNSLGVTEVTTPRYEYNQIMYRLDVDNPKLATIREGQMPPVYNAASDKP